MTIAKEQKEQPPRPNGGDPQLMRLSNRSPKCPDLQFPRNQNQQNQQKKTTNPKNKTRKRLISPNSTISAQSEPPNPVHLPPANSQEQSKKRKSKLTRLTQIKLLLAQIRN
jgi:hypothetical protein